MVALTNGDLLLWTEQTTAIWKWHLSSHPELLDLPCDITGSLTVSDLLHHIVAAELRYAERLSGIRETPYEQIPKGSVEALFGVHEHAFHMLLQLGSPGRLLLERDYRVRHS